MKPAALGVVVLLGLAGLGPPAAATAVPQQADEEPTLPTEADYYALHTVPVPDDIVLEVGGLLPRAGDGLLVCTRRGQVWHVTDASSDSPTFSLWADGLQEPLGLLAHDDGVLTTQRGELTALWDTTGDGVADVYQTICDDWDISGSYHEYAFGPRRDLDGNLWITLNIPFDAEPFGQVDWRGFALRITPEGEMQPVAGGLRSPAGIEVSPWGDVFYTDNQGEWNGASKLVQITEGSYHGHPLGIFSALRPESLVEHPGDNPDGVLMPTAARRVPSFTLPAVWFPYDVTGRSPSGMAWDQTGGAFGPFDGQLFVGDQYGANVLRVFLEQVEGTWQGACFRFREGLQSGVIRVAFDDADGLWIGMSDRGWSSLGPDTYGLQRLSWTGAVPFEMLAMEALAEGFRLTFTAPVDPVTAADPASWSARRFTYEWHSGYGSDEMDDWELDVEVVAVADDGLSVELRLDSPREGYVHELIAAGLTAVDGRPLLHDSAWYTLIERPGPERAPRIAVVGAPDAGLQDMIRTGLGLTCDVLAPDDLVGLRDADLVLLNLDELSLPDDGLQLLLRYVDSGRPFLALGASAMPFAAAPTREDFAEDAFGLTGRAPARTGATGATGALRVAPAVPPAERDPGFDPASHPVLRGVASLSASGGSAPTRLLDDCRVLLEDDGGQPAVWLRDRRGARVLVASLDPATDLTGPAGGRLLLNAVLWALDREGDIPPTAGG